MVLNIMSWYYCVIRCVDEADDENKNANNNNKKYIYIIYYTVCVHLEYWLCVEPT